MAKKNLYPVGDGDGGRKQTPVICDDCEFQETLATIRDTPEKKHLAICECGGKMFFDWGQMGFNFKMSGPGYHSTKQGQKMKRERIKRSEKLAKTQWDNHAPVPLPEGVTPKNPTKGGPYDPNSKFNK